jgi:hypothetical protein
MGRATAGRLGNVLRLLLGLPSVGRAMVHLRFWATDRSVNGDITQCIQFDWYRVARSDLLLPNLGILLPVLAAFEIAVGVAICWRVAGRASDSLLARRSISPSRRLASGGRATSCSRHSTGSRLPHEFPNPVLAVPDLDRLSSFLAADRVRRVPIRRLPVRWVPVRRFPVSRFPSCERCWALSCRSGRSGSSDGERICYRDMWCIRCLAIGIAIRYPTVRHESPPVRGTSAARSTPTEG